MSKQETNVPPEHFLNRELSWLEFNQRVLDEALNPATPLLERVKFFCITSSNLDEFFEVRVAGLKQQIESDVVERTVDGRTASETFRAVARRALAMVAQQYECWNEELAPALLRNGIRFLKMPELRAEDLDWVGRFYRTEVLPVLTPLGLDPAHPFPQLLNKSLNIVLELETRRVDRAEKRLAVVQLPRLLPRLIKLPREDGRQDYVFLGQIIKHHLPELFPGTRILGSWMFRVTRNSELYIDEEEIANLLKAVENELHNRRKGDAVRLEIEQGCPGELTSALLRRLRLTDDDLYVVNGPVNPTGLMQICQGDHSPELRDPPFVAPVAPALRGKADVFAAIRERDILLHHPYETFSTVVEFLDKAAQDPMVLAIKQTLYRTGGDTRIVGALMSAVRNGKQVTAVVELRARFDEANNIQWARQLEEAGVHVVYGLVGYKIHAKVSLIVRRDPDGIRRYVHLATGNYNASTARLYTDLGLLTCKPGMGEDATSLFNLLTGICQYQGSQKFLVAPFDLHERMLQLIAREAAHARQGLPARIIAKVNSLVDERIIAALYDASRAGVTIDLIVRGVCCLRPGLPGVSENVTVRSIVDRFLEHHRIYYFENAARPEVFLSSADWMPRNFFRRIEVAFPVEDGVLRSRIMDEILAVALADNVKARHLQADGAYVIPPKPRNTPTRRSQFDFIALAQGGSRINGKIPAGRHPRVQVRRSPPTPRPR
ncbi:MAG TPA: polyphosphate kinase 1 [Verrucomicrobiae bacterium]|nr:polyphosphate kinase 1 [Verrucomicrobiae bacterium]